MRDPEVFDLLSRAPESFVPAAVSELSKVVTMRLRAKISQARTSSCSRASAAPASFAGHRGHLPGLAWPSLRANVADPLPSATMRESTWRGEQGFPVQECKVLANSPVLDARNLT